MCGMKEIQIEPGMLNCDCRGVSSLSTKQEKIEKLEQYQKCLELALIEVKQKLRQLTENK